MSMTMALDISIQAVSPLRMASVLASSTILAVTGAVAEGACTAQANEGQTATRSKKARKDFAVRTVVPRAVWPDAMRVPVALERSIISGCAAGSNRCAERRRNVGDAASHFCKTANDMEE